VLQRQFLTSSRKITETVLSKVMKRGERKIYIEKRYFWCWNAETQHYFSTTPFHHQNMKRHQYSSLVSEQWSSMTEMVLWGTE